MQHVRRGVLPAVICAALFIFLMPLSAQIDVGRVAGTVTDPAGAVVPGAKLTLTNEGTGVAQHTQSAGSGTYVFTAVPPGAYTLAAQASGFKRYEQKGIEVHVQNTVTVDIPFSVGGISQQVTVNATAPLLQAADASVGHTVTATTTNDLPLNGRNWLQLADLAPGTYVVPGAGNSVTANPASSGTTPIIANGAEPGQVDFRLNGVNNNEEVFGGTTIAPVPDAIQEFKLQDGDNSAEFGHSAGAVVNAVIKSGTNQLHGDAWEYFRNEALNANDWFSNNNNQRRPEYRQNQFGATLGGPVYIPKLYDGRNKTFFFVDFQRTQAVAAVQFQDTIPTNLMRSSGFTNLQDLITGNQGKPRQDGLGRSFLPGTVFDPATTRSVAAKSIDSVTGLANTGTTAAIVRDPFYSGSLVGVTDFTKSVSQLNLIPGSRLDPNAIKLLSLLPAPTKAGLQNNYFINVPQRTTIDQYDIRIDHNISSKDSVFGVFSRSNAVVSAAQPFPGAAGGALQISFATTQPTYVLAVSETHLFSSTLVNEARVGLDHNYNTREEPDGNSLGLPGQFGIQGIPQIANNGGLPTINNNGFSSFGSHRFTPTLQTTGAQDYTDNVTKIFGSHEFRFGIQYDRIRGDITQPAYSRGNFNYSGQYSDIPNKNSNLVGVADFLLVPIASTVGSSFNFLGGPNSYNGSNYAGTNYSANYWGAYTQDTWKLTPKLTLDLGVRWDYFGPYSETKGGQANFIMNGGNGAGGVYYVPNSGCQVPRSAGFNSLLAGAGIAIQCVGGETVNKAQTTNFAPRVGFAYRLHPNLVVRGGYGISYGAFDSVGYGGTLGTNYPFQYTLNSPSTTSQVPITLANGQTASIEDTFGTIDLQDPTQVNGKNLALSGKQYNYVTPYIESENLTVQYQFTGKDSLQVGYVASLGRHLDALGYHNVPTQLLPPGVNQTNYLPIPNLGAKSEYLSSVADSNYRSMQAVYQHRFSAGLDVYANYTYGKCMSDDANKTGLGSGYRAEWLPGFGIAQDYALCSADSTHLVHVSGEYALPFGRGKMFLDGSNRVVNAFLGGWQVNFIYTYESGQPFNIGCPVATTSDFGCNAFLVSGQNPYAGPHNVTQWLNPAAFAQPPAATAVGQSDYSPLGGKPEQVRGPAFNNLDSSLFKQFSTSEHTRLEFRLETFNTFNMPDFANPTANLNFTNTKNFSQITSLRYNPRVGQLALKFYF